MAMRVHRVRFIMRLMSFAAVMTVLSPLFARCQAPDSWVGKRVITKFGTVLEPKPPGLTEAHANRENLAVTPREREKLLVYRVEQAAGQWLRLVAEEDEVSGWASVDRVIPLDRAIENYHDEIRARPSAESYNNRGLLWTAKGEYDRSITDISESIRLKANYAPGYNNRGLAWIRKGAYDSAIRDFGRAIQIEPTFASAYNNRGAAWSKKRETEKAIADGHSHRSEEHEGISLAGRPLV